MSEKGLTCELKEEAAKQRVFNRIDSLIDRGIDVLNLSKEVSAKEYVSIRKQASRVFGSYAQALTEYGFYDTNGTPSEIELAKCYHITDKYTVSVCVEEREHLLDLYMIDEVAFRKLSQNIVDSLEIDALDDFYRDHFPFDEYPTRRLREEFPKLYGYMRKHYGTYKRFLRAYKIPHGIVDRDYGGRDAISYGHEFERKLGVILNAIYPHVKYHEKVGDCVPDYIVGKTWIDAKLSAGTIYDTRSRTLDKYSKKTDDLIIYYARDKKPTVQYGIAKVKHVSTLYPALLTANRTDLISEMDAFITSISYGKEESA